MFFTIGDHDYETDLSPASTPKISPVLQSLLEKRRHHKCRPAKYSIEQDTAELLRGMDSRKLDLAKSFLLWLTDQNF